MSQAGTLSVSTRGDLRPGSYDAAEYNAGHQFPVMMVHPVCKASVTAQVDARHSLKVYRVAIGEYQAGPDHKSAFLSIGDFGIVFSYKPGSLGNQQVPSRDGIEHVFTDLGDDLTW